MADYERRKENPRELKPSFSIRKPYVLLSADEVKAFVKQRGQWPAATTDPRFQGVTDMFTLSDVYFNQRRTLALTGIGTWCGDLCGSYHWRVFEKVDNDKWEERRWTTCMTIADADRL